MLTYLVEHRTEAGRPVAVPARWPWFGEKGSGAIRLSDEEAAALLVEVNAGDAGDPLGEVYQRLLEERGGGVGRRGSRRRRGAFYTPPAIVNHLVRVSLGPLIERAESGGGRAAAVQ